MNKAYVTQYTVKQICEILEVELPEECSHIADDLLTNMSYRVKFLKEGGALFLAARSNEDRARLLDKAIAGKAKVVFVGQRALSLPRIHEIPHIVVKDVFGSVIRLSAHIRGELGLQVVGVTGSVGKTTTKDMVHAVLSQGFPSKKSMGNENTIFPIFNNLQKMPLDVRCFVQEFGAATPTVMPKTVGACIPNAGIITNIQDAHLDAFGTRANILKEKLQMITRMPPGSPAFLNYDDPLLRTVELEDYPIVFFSTKSKQADYYAENLKYFGDHMEFDIVRGEQRTAVHLNCCGEHNVGNAVVALAVGEWAGMKDSDIVRGLASYHATGIRQNLTNIGGYKLYIDCYNSGPLPMQNTARVLEQLQPEPGGKRVMVTSDIGNLGDSAPRLHAEVAEKLASSGIDLFLCFGNENAKLMADTLRRHDKPALYAETREQLNQWISGLITRKDVTAFKGGHARMLHKSIDTVYGACLHATHALSEYEAHTLGDFLLREYAIEGNPEKTVVLQKYNGSERAPELPSHLGDVEVSCIAPLCFVQNLNLQQVVIPESITGISAGAFRGCRKLTRVSLPESLRLIGRRAFRNCAALEEIVLPEGVIEIAEEAFSGCSSLKRVVLPSTLGRIGEDAFPKSKKIKFEYPANSYAESYVKNRDSKG